MLTPVASSSDFHGDTGSLADFDETKTILGVAAADGKSHWGRLATGSAVPKMAAENGHAIGDGTPIALLVQTRPRPAPGGTFSLDADWAADDGVTAHADGGYEVEERRCCASCRSFQVMEGNPKLEVASIGVGGKPIPGDGEPVVGAITAIPIY